MYGATETPQDWFFYKRKENQVDIFLEFHSCARSEVESHCAHLVKSKQMKPWITICYLTSLDNFRGGEGKSGKKGMSAGPGYKKTCLLKKTCVC